MQRCNKPGCFNVWLFHNIVTKNSPACRHHCKCSAWVTTIMLLPLHHQACDISSPRCKCFCPFHHIWFYTLKFYVTASSWLFETRPRKKGIILRSGRHADNKYLSLFHFRKKNDFRFLSKRLWEKLTCCLRIKRYCKGLWTVSLLLCHARLESAVWCDRWWFAMIGAILDSSWREKYKLKYYHWKQRNKCKQPDIFKVVLQISVFLWTTFSGLNQEDVARFCCLTFKLKSWTFVCVW